MALKQHKDDHVRYEQQVDNSRQYVMPFIEQTKPVREGINILEIGCGEGGVLTPFIEKGAYCVGVDLDQPRVNLAKENLAKEIANGKALFLYKNVYDADFVEKYKGFFDIIILKDTIEHIPEQEKFIPHLHNFLKKEGQIFFGFPPWYMPFGGHQQTAQNKIAMLPWYHVLPKPVYKGVLKMMGEPTHIIKDLMDIYDTRITIERFERIVKKSGFTIKNKQHYLFNPIYRYKFGWKPRRQSPVVSAIPFFRNFVTTCVYYTIG